MNKYILLFLSLTSINLLSVRAIAQPTQSCVNYWTNPQTGKQECLTVTYKPSFQYLGKITKINKITNKKVTIKFYIEKNAVVRNGASTPVKQVMTFSNGYRFDNVIVIGCDNRAIAYKSEVVSLKGKIKGKDEYQTLEFEPINLEDDSAETRTYNYICNGIIPKN